MAKKKLTLTAALKKKGVTKADIVRVNKVGKTISIEVTPQRKKGTSTETDKRRQALPPGKRLTPSGSVYSERRKNRSDKNRRKKI